MQLKGLVRIFAIALILICLYQLSFTWFVRNHESDMDAKADKWIHLVYTSPEKKYPNSAELKTLYADTLKQKKDSLVKHLLDSTRDAEIGPFGLTTYRNAKDKELMLGLDLQGGIGVTMEVGLDGLLKSLANFTKDPAFNKALDAAVLRKANSGADLITLFAEEYKKQNPTGSLAALFAARSNGKVKFDANDNAVLSYLKDQAAEAFNNTVRIITTRIDRFGVASPNINPDPAKGTINIELAGVNDPERVRAFLQSTANLQFFEVYTLDQAGDAIVSADKVLQDYLKGIKADSTGKTADSSKVKKAVTPKATAAKGKDDTSKTAVISAIAPDSGKKIGNAKADSAKNKTYDNPIVRLIQFSKASPSKDGTTQIFPGAIGYIQTKDTGTLNSYLRMDFVKAKFPSNLVFMYGKLDNKDEKTKNILSLYAIKTLDNGQAKLEGGMVKNASQDFDERGNAAIKMDMNSEGTRLWAEMTTKNRNRPIAIVLDNFVYSAPNVDEPITTGNSQIRGNFTLKEAQDLSEILMTGKLPAPARIVQEEVVGPTLGKAAVNGGALSFLIAFIVIFVLMLIYYNTGGWVANIALILNLLFTIGILSAMGFTLTAPGIAALVLTVGMAVDTNVIIFERIKEEIVKGKGYQTAVNDGYRRSLAPVLDAHVTTLLTAIILFKFGLGPVLGFATTQIIGILLSLFCGILVSRLITDWYTNKQRHFQYFTTVSKKIFKHASFKFIEYRKIAYGISVVVLLLGVGAYFNGFDKGVEFEGGRSYTVKFDRPVNQVVLAADLKKTFEGQEVITKTVGTADQLNITTAYRIKENGKNIDSLVERTLYTGLKNYLPQGVSYEEFDTKYKQASQKVLPSISDDLKSGATKAVIYGLIIICLYIFIRFRDWRYSLGTIVSLLHDVFVTLAVFSFLRKVVPFPLEINQHFIAAVLTVIGFSMNDTVIVFDRIREYSGQMKGVEKGIIINKAINDTLSRTIMTSLTVFLTLLILFIFGGEVTRGFAFAMLIGVITGTYSSIFVAAPILVDFARNRPLGGSEEKKKR